MKISVELSDSEINEIRQFTHEKRKGPAIRRLVIDALRLAKRQELCAKFASNEWSVDLPAIEDLRQDRRL